MGAKRHERTHARKHALQILYQSVLVGDSVQTILDEKSYLAEDGSPGEYTIALIKGVEDNSETIDAYLKETSENWALKRMPVVDLSILRLATYEMIFEDSVPVSVSINEAVELAKDYGGEDDSPRFVNGVLGRIARRLEEEALNE